MRRSHNISLIILMSCVCSVQLSGQTRPIKIPLNSINQLSLINVQAKTVDLDGRQGVQLSKNQDYKEGETIAIVKGIEFENGTIEIDLAGEPAPEANVQSRGFVGGAFRLQEKTPFSYECF